MKTESIIAALLKLAEHETNISVGDVRKLMRSTTALFRNLLQDAGHEKRKITRLTTKFRDAGRRSPPWKPHSSRVPGQPQDGADGNRTNRWLLPENHKFYATEVTATLVEVRYYFQALSMKDAPTLPKDDLRDTFQWLLGHPLESGRYLDPIQLTPISLEDFIADPRLIQSGHFIPLDRGGRHEPSNAFLMLKQSNQLQGNLTLPELLRLMDHILARHREQGSEW